jgi:hypothetical protein
VVSLTPADAIPQGERLRLGFRTRCGESIPECLDLAVAILERCLVSLIDLIGASELALERGELPGLIVERGNLGDGNARPRA